jgi:hypothetical protein
MRQEADMVGIRATTSAAAISSTTAGARAASKQASAGPPAVGSRALVAVTPVTRSDAPAPVARRTASAAFVAQLIATREQLPQTRERRRAEPADAIGVYAATLAMTPATFALAVSRMM